MAKKSTAKRVARLESIVVSAGFLLQRLYATYHDDFSVGLEQQVRECLRDCNDVARAKAQRETAQSDQQQKGGAA